MAIDQGALRRVSTLEGEACFGCGAANPVGLQMRFHTDGERMYSFVDTVETMVGWDRTVHGGILSTLLDEIMGWTVIHLLGKIGVTRSMTVDFLKPVTVGSRLTVIGTVGERRSDRLVLVQGEIRNAGDVLCVRSTGSFATLSPQAALRLGIMGSEYMQRFEPLLQPQTK